MANLKKLSVDTIRSWGPCYDPIKRLPDEWTGDIIDLLKRDEIPFRDRLWCALRTSVVSEKLMRLYAIKTARSVEHLMKDERSKIALNVAQAFVEGLATREELITAKNNAYADAADAADAAAAYAAYAAADAACAAAYAAADAAAYAAAYAAYAADAADASYAADDKKKYQEQQIDLLKDMIIKGIETGDSQLEKST